MTDRLTVLVVVASLAALALLTAGGIIALAMSERGIPDALIGISSASIGALGGVLVSTRSSPPLDPPG